MADPMKQPPLRLFGLVIHRSDKQLTENQVRAIDAIRARRGWKLAEWSRGRFICIEAPGTAHRLLERLADALDDETLEVTVWRMP